MTFIKSKIILFLALIPVVFSVAGCESLSDNFDITKEVVIEETPPEPVTLDIVLSSYSNATSDIWQRPGGISERFKEEYPYITLNIQVFSWDSMYELMDRLIATGNQPDILNIDTYRYYSERGLLSDIGKYITEQISGDILPGYTDGYALPVLASPRVLFCNADLFGAAGITRLPTDRESLVNACRRYRQIFPDTPMIGIDVSQYGAYDSFGFYTYSGGGGFLAADGTAALDSPANLEILGFLKQLKDEGLARLYDGIDGFARMRAAFKNGELAAIMAPQVFAEDCTDMNISVTSLCELVPGSANPTLCDSFVVFNNDAKTGRDEAITRFFEFFYSPDNYLAYTSAEGYYPLTLSACEAGPGEDPVYEMMKNSKPYPINSPQWDAIKEQAYQLMQISVLQ